jgi:hypothetical protein
MMTHASVRSTSRAAASRASVPARADLVRHILRVG